MDTHEGAEHVAWLPFLLSQKQKKPIILDWQAGLQKLNHENEGKSDAFLREFDGRKNCGSPKKWRAQEFCEAKYEWEGGVVKSPKPCFIRANKKCA